MCSGSAGGILTPISSLDLNALGNLPAAKGVDAEQSALENGLTLVLKNIEFRLLDSDGATSAILKRTDPRLAILPCANIYWQASARD